MRLILRFIIFVYGSSSFFHSHSLLRNYIICFLVSVQLNNICLSSFPIHRGHVPFSNPLLIPLSFQTAASIGANQFISFLDQNSIYSSLPHLCFTSWSRINVAFRYHYTSKSYIFWLLSSSSPSFRISYHRSAIHNIAWPGLECPYALFVSSIWLSTTSPFVFYCLPSSITATSFAVHLGSASIFLQNRLCILSVSFHASSDTHDSSPYVILDSHNISFHSYLEC
jgi:hypothetical protein